MLALQDWLFRGSTCMSIPLTDSSLTHSNLAAVLNTLEVGQLEYCLFSPDSVDEKIMEHCDNDEEQRNELISYWLQSSPYALDSWKWLSGRLLYWEEESALAAAKRYVHISPGVGVAYNISYSKTISCFVALDSPCCLSSPPFAS